EVLHDGRALRRLHPRPLAVVERVAGGCHRTVDVRLGAVGHSPDDLLAVWGDHIYRARPRGIDPLATDEQLVVYAHGRTLAVIVCAVVTRELHALLPAERLVAHALPRHAVDHPEGQVVVPADQLAQ